MALSVAWRSLYQGGMARDPRELRRLGNVVDVGPERDHWLARSPTRHPSRGNTGNPFLNRKSVVAQEVHQIARSLELLKPELSEAEDLIHDLLCELAAGIDILNQLAFEVRNPVSLRMSRLRHRVLPSG